MRSLLISLAVSLYVTSLNDAISQIHGQKSHPILIRGTLTTTMMGLRWPKRGLRGPQRGLGEPQIELTGPQMGLKGPERIWKGQKRTYIR